jgi:hypothetical protein
MKALITPTGEFIEAETYEQLFVTVNENAKYPLWSLIEKGFVLLCNERRRIWGTCLCEELKTYVVDEKPEAITKDQKSKLIELNISIPYWR